MSAPGDPGGAPDSPGTLLANRRRIISALGKGGMGEVYRPDDIRLGQPMLFFVALLGAAFYTSLGDKPLFGRALLED